MAEEQPENQKGGDARESEDNKNEAGDSGKESPSDKLQDGQNTKSGDEKSEKEKKAQAERDRKRKKARPFVILGLCIVAAILIVGGIWYWLANRNLEETDDAYTDGRAISIAPQISGQVVSLDVNDNQFVHKGDVLIHIDDRPFIYARDQARASLLNAQAQLDAQKLGAEIARKNFPAQLLQAKAQLANARATLFKAQTDARRQLSLPKEATTQQDVDYAVAALHQAEAQVQSAEAEVEEQMPVPQRIGQTDAQVSQLESVIKNAQAQLQQADLNLAWTSVTAPQDGWITKRNVEMGNYVTAGQQIFAIVSPEVWITANYKEDQLTRIRDGQKAVIRVDAYPKLRLHGHVDSLQLGSGSKFTAFPPENATGNFVKIVQRIPVKIVIDSGLDPNIPLPLGISVEPSVTVK